MNDRNACHDRNVNHGRDANYSREARNNTVHVELADTGERQQHAAETNRGVVI